MIRHNPSSSHSARAKKKAQRGDNEESFGRRLDHILAAATELIAREGYEKASMRAVASAANVSLAGIYHYFDSKERMLFLIQFRTFTALLNSLRERLCGAEDPFERFRIFVRNHVDYFVANMSTLKACSHELDSLTGPAFDEILQIRRDYYDLVRSIIDRLMDTVAANSPLDRHIATMSLFGTLNWLYRWYDPRRGRSPTTLANQIIEQFVRGVLEETPRGATPATDLPPPDFP